VWTLKLSAIYGVFSTLIICLLILSLVNKFGLIIFFIWPEKNAIVKKKIDDQIKKNKILNSGVWRVFWPEFCII